MSVKKENRQTNLLILFVLNTLPSRESLGLHRDGELITCGALSMCLACEVCGIIIKTVLGILETD